MLTAWVDCHCSAVVVCAQGRSETFRCLSVVAVLTQGSTFHRQFGYVIRPIG